MLVPKDVSVTGTQGPEATPLPKPRPKEIGTEEAMAKGTKGKDAVPADTPATTASVPRP